MSVRPFVCVVDHALTAEPIDFIFGMHIDVIPRSDIGILDFKTLEKGKSVIFSLIFEPQETINTLLGCFLGQ